MVATINPFIWTSPWGRTGPTVGEDIRLIHSRR